MIEVGIECGISKFISFYYAFEIKIIMKCVSKSLFQVEMKNYIAFSTLEILIRLFCKLQVVMKEEV